jgi:hypothetical protein
MSFCVTGVLTNAIPIYTGGEMPHVFSSFDSKSITKSLTQNVSVMLTDASLLWQTAPDAHFEDFTYDTSDHIIASKSGHYAIIGDMDLRSVNGGGEYKMFIKKNDITIATKNAECQTSGFFFSIPINVGVEMEAGDKIHLEFVNTSNGNDIQVVGGSIIVHTVHLT